MQFSYVEILRPQLYFRKDSQGRGVDAQFRGVQGGQTILLLGGPDDPWELQQSGSRLLCRHKASGYTYSLPMDDVAVGLAWEPETVEKRPAGVKSGAKAEQAQR